MRRGLTPIGGLEADFWESRCKSLLLQPNGAGTSNISAEYTSSAKAHLLTCGRAWALSLSQRSSLSEGIFRICFPCNDDVIEESLLYRVVREVRNGSALNPKSYVHGKGMNRFWSNVEGYHGPLLLLISAILDESSESTGKWIIGGLIQEGLENRDVFYGSGGCLYSMYPVFHVFTASGKEHNYLYSHLHPAVRVYERNPKPLGIGFGGSIGNERVFIDEDFAKVTIRHHAVDKTYQPGSLFPTQDFLPVEASILEVEVWGLGGKTAKEVQISYKKREELFTEQRRKVDLKTFGSWEDSPEKMMMDMISNPNTVRREER
ncbi:hypothetical protein Cgig2_027402 [Carnegiea gigantea]|uniref:TLDc domain-containing protein n=1 Tax=Carnegiea gigantea TaxID=171969 RepID=A0A9Q1K5E4_9CARY|nr:hypothetical protein Cgig2_027402 [Carnegiea gigantea]